MRMRTLSMIAALALSAATPAVAQDRHTTVRYGTSYQTYGGYPGGYEGGFAAPLINGDYVGAPFTAVPRPSQLVPPAWSYGTYGIPTVSGIAAPPVAAPTLTVIDAPQPRRRVRQGFVSRKVTSTAPGVRVVNLTLPHR
ncbi:hypothetical protein [Methylobacterium aerolatum]|uniref:Uncharacterized protein n=1 Tax=Methylobacterium aerolatum TaxID=418708 RepID=A0ABU0HYC0_9HYPH|nr:hypothetical protein [Methylobacterium aerolatum]MDQ0447300.1 hypothetical protein [Methylobacterium aerolatum]GJD36964.1 hypothetical protein FMGBMHLM_3890 [Methylobacterium aerolatum]